MDTGVKKLDPNKKIDGTSDRLVPVAQNLYRDAVTGIYYGKRSAAGKSKGTRSR